MFSESKPTISPGLPGQPEEKNHVAKTLLETVTKALRWSAPNCLLKYMIKPGKTLQLYNV